MANRNHLFGTRSCPGLVRRITFAGLLLIFFGTSALLQSNSANAADAFVLVENTGGAAGDGITDDTEALQSVLDQGQWVVLGSNKTYRITSSLQIKVSGTGVGSDGTATLLMGAADGEFDNELSGRRYGKQAVGIYANGVDNPWVDGIKIRYEEQKDDRYVKAIAFRNCTNISIKLNDISNFSKGYGIVYVGGSTGGVISGNEIHDSYTNSSLDGQVTGIEFDNDDLGSSDIEVTDNYIHDLTVGPTFQALQGYQTDGINATTRSHNLHIARNRIENIGEGIDIFAFDSVVEANRITDAHTHGIKLVHGASRNKIQGNEIYNATLVGIAVTGSTSVSTDTQDNYILNNRIVGINTKGWSSSKQTAGIAITYKPTTGFVRRNHIIYNTVDLGGTGGFGIVAKPGLGSDNEIRTNMVSNFLRKPYAVDKDVVPIFSKY